jgi:hypothetical protein
MIGFDDETEWGKLLIDRPPDDARRDADLQLFALASFVFAAMRAHKRDMERQAEVV